MRDSCKVILKRVSDLNYFYFYLGVHNECIPSINKYTTKGSLIVDDIINNVIKEKTIVYKNEGKK